MSTHLVIGIGGRLASGKDTVADHLVDKHQFVKIGMSDVLAKMIMIHNPWIRLDKDLVHEGTVVYRVGEFVRYQLIHDVCGYVGAKEFTEVRRWLQLQGTDIGRRLIDEDVWVDIGRRRIIELVDAGNSVVITGIRYANELSMIHEGARHGSASTRATSSWHSLWVDRTVQDPIGSTTTAHTSENSVTADDFEYVLHNHGSLGELYEAADRYLDWIKRDNS